MKNLIAPKLFLILFVAVGGMIIFPKDVRAVECGELTFCGNSCSYGGVTYNTVAIGDQCWFRQNLNVGEMITNLEMPDNTAPTVNDPDTVSKWCFNDNLATCDSEGGLYTWAEANTLPNSCNFSYCSVSAPNQGICPEGWHIPSDTEFYTLENYLTTPGETCDPVRDSWGCSDAGIKLRLGGNSGFDAISAGNHETNGNLSFFDKREPSIHFWSSSPCLVCSNWGHAYGRSLIGWGDNPFIARGWGQMIHGISVRCVSDTAVNIPLRVEIDIKPRGEKNVINLKGENEVLVAILSKADFSAPLQADRMSLTFGKNGDENSLVGCARKTKDFNNDGLLDLGCTFKVRSTGFECGDTEGILRGKINSTGVIFEGRQTIRVVPCRRVKE